MPRGNGGIIGPVNTSFSGVWSLTEAQIRRSSNTWPNFYAALLSESATGSDAVTGADTADPYFEYTTLLLPGNGTNGAQNNTFLDSSTNNFTITRNGNTTQGTFSPFSQTGWGNYFDGSSYIGNTSTTSVVAAGTSNFTAEFWVYATTDQQSQAYGTVFHVGGATSGAWFIGLLYSSAGAMKIRIGTYAADYDSTSTIAPNRWYHIALVREGTGSNQTKVYVDGSLFHTFTLSDNFSNSSAIYVGTTGFNLAARRLSGYVSNLRFTVGTALYTTAFTPATSPLTTTSQGATASQVEVLTCQSNRFLDNSSNGWTFTTSGSPTVVAFSPFAPTAAYSTSVVGGSGYFDGNGDYLSVADNDAFALGSNDWTIECWVYVSSLSAQGFIAQVASSGADTTVGFILGINASGYPYVSSYINGAYTAATASTAIVTNQWNHIAGSRASGTMGVFLNGSRLASTAVSGSSVNSTATVTVGASQSGLAALTTGYISGARIVNGTAVYSGTTYTVPTAPLTNITNTSLLLNFTNAGVYDATSKNDLETVGNAQISNAVTPKWGSTSIKFDGTGDWLLIPDQPPQRIGTGNFTVEMWIYRNSSGTYGLAGKGTGTTGWLVSLNSSNQVVFTYGSSTITSSGTVSATTWTHIAVVREGTSTNQTKIYISGSNDGTGTVSTDFNQTNSMYIGADRTGGSAANAYVQDVRITNYARYTSNFTAPTAAFPLL